MTHTQIIVLPGLDGDAALRASLQAALSSIAPAKVIGYPRELHRYNDMQSHVAPLLPSGDFILIAESYGGPLAIMLAARGLSGLRGIIFVVSFACQPRFVPHPMLRALNWLPKPPRWAMKTLLRIGGGRKAKGSAIAAMTEVGLNLPNTTSTGRLRAVLSVDVRAELAALRIPMVYVQAASDRSVPRRAAHDFTTAGVDLIRIPGTHYLMVERPECTAQALEEPIRAMLSAR